MGSDGQDNASGTMAQLLKDGASNIPTYKVDFQSLDTERLTEEQQTVIQQRQAQLQLLWQRRQKQEEAEQAQERERKLQQVLEIHTDISERAAACALEQCEQSPGAAVEALTDIMFKRRIQALVGDRALPPKALATRSAAGAPKQPAQPQAPVDPSSVDCRVFNVGKFRQRGPILIAGGAIAAEPAAAPTAPAAPAPAAPAAAAVAAARPAAAARLSPPAAELLEMETDEERAAVEAAKRSSRAEAREQRRRSAAAAPAPEKADSSRGAAGSGGSDGSVGTSVRADTPEHDSAGSPVPAGAVDADTAAAAANMASAAAECPATPTRAGGSDADDTDAPISPPSGGWSSPGMAAPGAAAAAAAAAAADAAPEVSAAFGALAGDKQVRSPQTRLQSTVLAAQDAQPLQPQGVAYIGEQHAEPAAAVHPAPAAEPAQGQGAATAVAAAELAPGSAQRPRRAAAAAAALQSDEETISMVDVGDSKGADADSTSAPPGVLRPLSSPGRDACLASRKPPKRAAASATAAGKRAHGSGAISRNGGTVRGRVRQKSHKQAALIELGVLRPEAGWYNAGYIFPDNFKSRVNFRSSVQLDQLVAHDCAIIGEGGQHWPAPTFRVVAADRPDQPLVAKSCTGCWTQVLKRINAEIEARRRAGEDLPPPPKTAIAGPEYFGLNQPEIAAAVEDLDGEELCDLYWVGKNERAAVAAGLPPPPRPAALARAVRGPPSARGRKKRRRGSDEDSEEDAEGEAGGVASKWSAVSRTSRYRTRCGTKGAGDVDASNPLPERVDPITLEAVVSPAISPYGHVMGAATWRAVLAEKGRCPFTGQPLSWQQCTMLTHSNIERFRDRIRDG